MKWYERCKYCQYWGEDKEGWSGCSKHNSQTMYEDWCSLFRIRRKG